VTVGFCCQVLEQIDLQRKVQGGNVKAFSLLCVLKLSKAQLNTKACRVSYRLCSDCTHVYNTLH